MAFVLLIAGLVLLVVGAEALVRGASRLAGLLGVSPLVIGLTIVAYGTSSPELAVSVQAAYAGQGEIAIGNVIGSNICNVLLILGASALAAPLVVAQQLVRVDVPIMIGASLLLGGFALDGEIARWEGLSLVAGAIVYSIFLLRQSRRERNAAVQAEYEAEYPPQERSRRAWLVNGALILLGLALLTWGSRWLVDGAVEIARSLGVSELVIGLTIIAVGTSLPEGATSVMASLRGERDIAVGNVVGSNIFNLLLVMGGAAALAPRSMPVPAQALALDLPVMVAVAVAALPIFFTGYRIGRGKGAVFLGFYVAYLAYLVLDATGNRLLEPFTTGMLFFVLPLTAITLVALAVLELRARRG